jgi:hypothetical protein
MQGGGGGVNHFPDRQCDLINENYRSNYAQLRLRIAIALRRAHHAVAAGTTP